MYEDYYGLTAKPFQLNPDPRFFYASRGHKRAMAYLEYGVSVGQGFIVITGEIGAGKTTLVRNMLASLPPSEVVAGQLVTTQLEADDLLRMVSGAFRLPVEGHKASLLQNLEEYLLSLHAQGRRALLLVDEAQNLPPRAVEELRMLSNFQKDEQSLLQSFLLGQPEFRGTIQSARMQQLRERVIASYHLGPLDEDDTRGYVEHRLTTAGWTGNPYFTNDAFPAIFSYTSGIPRRINVLCDRLMLLGFLEEREEINRALVDQVTDDIRQETCAMPESDEPVVGDGARRPDSVDLLEDLVRLEARVDRVELGLERMRSLSNRLLTIASENIPEKGR